MLKTLTGATELKEDGLDKGSFAAQVATTGVVDKDGDYTLKGAFAEAGTVRVSRFNHSSAVRDDLPVGIASIREDGNAVIAEGKLNLESPGGRELYETLTFEQSNGVKSEWSYGFTVEDSEDGHIENQKVEISPVMRAAGEQTATLAIKSATDFADLPLYDRDTSWDSTEALGRVRQWASSDGSGEKDTIDWEAYKKAFFWYDDQDDSSFAGFKLPFADITDGKLYAVPRAIFAVAAVLQGARGGVAIGPEDEDHVKDTVDRYYEKMRDEFDDDSIVPPWTKNNNEGITFAHEGDLVLASLDAYMDRTKQLVALRSQQGRAISSINRKRLSSLVDSMEVVIGDVGEILAATEPQKSAPDVLRQLAAFQHTITRYG
jgi:hypothetical protein